jgi:hypothetical protein
MIPATMTKSVYMRLVQSIPRCGICHTLSVTMRGLFVLFAVLIATAVNAQDTAEISGVVRGSSQAPIAGVRITVINQATRSETISYTDNAGFY